MGRIRAALAADEADREMHRHLANAERYLCRALDTCGKVMRLKRSSAAENSIKISRARENQKMIRRALSIISDINNMAPRIDMADEDLFSEEQRLELSRQRREARRREK